MLKKFRNVFSRLFNTKKADDIVFLNYQDFISVDITWADIIESFPYSEKTSCISYAFKRLGYNIVCKNDFVELENGDILYPQELSEHWRFFVGSSKCKPKTIKYFKL